MKKMMKKLIIFTIILVMALAITFYVSYHYNDIKIKNYRNEQTNINEIINTKLTNKEKIEKFKKEFNNNDIVGILKVSDIINIPIPMGKDNKHYLEYGLGNKKIYGGSSFIDYRTPLKSKQINIYGHNSPRIDIPFNNLEKYLDKDYIKDHDIIELSTEDKDYKYIITYVYKENVKGTNEHYKYEYKNEEDWNKHLSNMKEKSFYINENDITSEDNILVLQTCLYGNEQTKFLVIVAKQIE